MSGANVSGELMIQAAPGGEDTYMHTASFDGYIWWIHLVDTYMHTASFDGRWCCVQYVM